MKWLVIFLIILIILVAVMAWNSNSDSIGADSSLADLERRIDRLEGQVFDLEFEVFGYPSPSSDLLPPSLR